MSLQYPAWIIEMEDVNTKEEFKMSFSDIAMNDFRVFQQLNHKSSCIIEKVLNGTREAFRFNKGRFEIETSENSEKVPEVKIETPKPTKLQGIVDSVCVEDIDETIRLLLLKKYGIVPTSETKSVEPVKVAVVESSYVEGLDDPEMEVDNTPTVQEVKDNPTQYPELPF